MKTWDQYLPSSKWNSSKTKRLKNILSSLLYQTSKIFSQSSKNCSFKFKVWILLQMTYKMVIGLSLISWNSKNKLSKFQQLKNSRKQSVWEHKKVKVQDQDQGRIEKIKAIAKFD
jgi:hypothetical protein